MLFIRVRALRRASDVLIGVMAAQCLLLRGRSPFSFFRVPSPGRNRPGVPSMSFEKKEICHES